MPFTDDWRDLHRTRFPELPLDCGMRTDPGVLYSEELRDWSNKVTTPDQKRMEQYIDRYDLSTSRILHIGIGNSGLAQRFHRRVGQIVGTTIDDPEMCVARLVGIGNYEFLLHNKYSGSNRKVEGTFDFILDNNPTSPCCCIRHLAILFDFYAEKLASRGQIVTDRQGLEWVPENGNPRWSFDFDDLVAVGALAGYAAFRINRNIYVLSRARPPAPGALSLSRHAARRLVKLPGQLVRDRASFARIARKTLKNLLIATVPWVVPARYKSGDKA